MVVRDVVVVPVVTAPKQPSVLEGKTIVLPCEAAGIPAPTVNWKRKNEDNEELNLVVSAGRHLANDWVSSVRWNGWDLAECGGLDGWVYRWMGSVDWWKPRGMDNWMKEWMGGWMSEWVVARGAMNGEKWMEGWFDTLKDGSTHLKVGWCESYYQSLDNNFRATKRYLLIWTFKNRTVFSKF